MSAVAITTSNNKHPSTTVITKTTPAAPHTTSTTSGGLLTATILSAYDLPLREPPSYVTISINDSKSVQSGPPAQRHKDRNSFKFNRETVRLQTKTLPELYAATATVTVAYPNHNMYIQAEYALQQLKIHETTWLILQLEGSNTKDDDDDDAAIPPTIRLQLTLSGPYRAEIGFLVQLLEGWFHFVDVLEDGIGHPTQKYLQWMQQQDPKLWLIPAVPAIAALVVSAPVIFGGLAVTLPLALPFLVAASGILGVVLLLGAFLYSSTRTGRSQIGSMLAPIANTVRSTKVGQTALYQTGPRPTPVSLARLLLGSSGFWGKLVVSLMIDAIGSASYLVPVVGEVTDLGWAPIQTILVMALYEEQQQTQQNAEWLKYVSFAEEILPFTDIVPTATLGWLLYVGVPHWMGGSSSSSSAPTTTTKTKTVDVYQPAVAAQQQFASTRVAT